MSGCQLCPRACGADRVSTYGICAQGIEMRVSRAAPHMWEEPCLSGKRGSGTVFFTGCTLGCVYCQNHEISGHCAMNRFPIITPCRLAEIFLKLQHQGVHNINLVTPTMFAPKIAEGVDIARESGLTLPIIYNTSGYELPEALDIMGERIDIYLPDFKYISGNLAKKYSGAENYPYHAAKSLSHMVKKIGNSVFDSDGIMTRGVIVRHLLLPGQLRDSIRLLDYLYSTYQNDIYYSLMSQYTPTVELDKDKFPELSRRVTTYEYNKLIEHAINLGIKNAFIQSGSSARESFIPDFNGI